MNKQVLVTGVNGFVGHHVARQLSEQGESVIGVGNQETAEPNVIEYVNEYVSCDLTDTEQVAGINLKNIDAVINLAGFAKVGDSKDQDELYNRVNVGVHTVLYEECLRQDAHPRIIAVSTGAVYDPNQPLPITEDSKVIEDDRTNVYVISKKRMERAALAFNDRGLQCIIARPFNHTGPGQLPGFLLPDLFAAIEDSLATNKPLGVGNLDTRRDFTDVRDVARAYIELALCDEASLNDSIYNICSGKSVSGHTILGLVGQSMGITDIQTEIDKTKLRENEVMDIYGSAERLKAATGWVPTIAIEQTIQDFVTTKRSK